MLQFLLDFEQSIRKQCEIDRPRLGRLECSQILVRNVDGPLRSLKLTAHPISPPPQQFYGRPNRTALGDMVNPDYGIIRIETDSGHSGIGDICTVFSPGGKSLYADSRRCHFAKQRAFPASLAACQKPELAPRHKFIWVSR